MDGTVVATGRHRVVIVDDEPDVRETFGDYLAMHDFDVMLFDGAAALRRWLDDGGSFDVALLDISMPGEDGLSLARHLRERTKAGVVMVSAHGDPIDRVVGLEMGADDYLAKPVELRELVARVKAVLRRTHVPPAPVDAPPPTTIAVGPMTLDLDARRLIDAAGGEVPLTAMEFDLLRVLAERPNRVLSREQLLDLSHKRSDEPFDRSIDIRIARIRRKIEHDPGRPQIIKTVRGAGYVFSRGEGR
ncbi:MAG: response regulator transcription factor [Alphaproteobacteria bacterium]